MRLKEVARTVVATSLLFAAGEVAVASEGPDERVAFAKVLGERRGFVVWSSNRFGDAEILMATLPDLHLRRLTNHPHVDYFPRISPDGKRIAFARSKAPGVSHRKSAPWDVFVYDIDRGEERLAARDGNTPTWSADGRTLYFQRNEGQVVAHALVTGEERVLAASGTGAIPPGVSLGTPSVNDRTGEILVTLRGRTRMTARITPDGNLHRVAGGCQIAWSPDGRFTYWVGDGGRLKNLFYRADPQGKQARPWLDLPGRFSHEYFPKWSNIGDVLVFGASRGGHEHDRADYDIFLWRIGTPSSAALRVAAHPANDNWPDVYLRPELESTPEPPWG